MTLKSFLQKPQVFATIVYRLVQSPAGVQINHLRNEYGISERNWRNYFNELKEIPILFDSEGKSLIYEERIGEIRYLKLRTGISEPEKALDSLAGFYMASSLMNYLSGTKVFEPLDNWVRQINKQGLKFSTNYLDKKIYAISEFPKNYSKKDHIIRKVLTGVIDQRNMDIHYRSLSKGTNKLLKSFKPLTFLQYRYGLYLVGNKDKNKEITTLAIDRIMDAQLLPEKFHYPFDWSPYTYFSQGIGIIKGEKNYYVELIFDKHIADLIKERRYHKTAQLTDMKNGSLKLTMTIDSIAQLVPWVLSFGSMVRVVKPEELRDRVIGEVSVTLSKYKRR